MEGRIDWGEIGTCDEQSQAVIEQPRNIKTKWDVN